MNLIQNIANQIERRIETQARERLTVTGRATMGDKAKSDAALEQWCGAAHALIALEGPDGENAQWVLRVVTMAIAPRGYRETQYIAKQGRDADAAANASTHA